MRTAKGNWMIQSTCPDVWPLAGMCDSIERSLVRRAAKIRKNHELHPPRRNRPNWHASRPHAASWVQPHSPLVRIIWNAPGGYNHGREKSTDGQIEQAMLYCLARRDDFEARPPTHRNRRGAAYYHRWAGVLLDDLAKRFLEADRLAWRARWLSHYRERRQESWGATAREAFIYANYICGRSYPGPWAAVYNEQGAEPEPLRSIRTRARQMHEEMSCPSTSTPT